MAANAKSGPAVAPVNQALDIVAAEVGCPAGAGQLECLRKVDFYDFQTEKFNTTYNTWFTPAVDNITRYQDYESRFAAGNYASQVPLLTGNSDGEGAVFSLVYGAQNTNFHAWLDTFEADVAEIPRDILEAAYNISDFHTVSEMSGQQYGDARFFCPVDYLQDLRSTVQDTWAYRFFGNYSNVWGLPVSAPTHGTEIPFFLGGNECFDAIDNVTEAEQALADYQNDWFLSWVKNPSAGPGWDKVKPGSGTIAKLGVPGNELAIELATTADFNSRCQSVSCFLHSISSMKQYTHPSLGLQPIPSQISCFAECKLTVRYNERLTGGLRALKAFMDLTLRTYLSLYVRVSIAEAGIRCSYVVDEPWYRVDWLIKLINTLAYLHTEWTLLASIRVSKEFRHFTKFSHKFEYR